MDKNTLLYGLIAGLIVSVILVVSTTLCYSNPNFQSNMYIGFGAMFIAFSMIFVGVKNFRDKQNNGVISFGKAFKIGFFIALIASTLYVLVWLVEYYFFIPDFMDKYTAHVLKEAYAEGGSQATINAKIAEMNTYKEMYKNPLYVVLLTYMEILPLGLVLSVISAAVFKKKINSTLPA